MIIECRNLNKQYRNLDRPHLPDIVTAAHNVNLVVDRGDFVFIVGHPRQGKSTLLKLIGGLIAPDSGKVLVNGVIGISLQNGTMTPNISVLENVMLPLTSDRSARGSHELARDILSRFGLQDKMHLFPGQLSGTELKRVGTARAFINQPDIILCDEPTGVYEVEEDGTISLQSLQKEREIISQIFQYYNSRGTTFVLVTHDLHLMNSITSKKVYEMHRGCLTPGPGS